MKKATSFELVTLVELLNGALKWKNAARVRREIAQDISEFVKEPTLMRLLSLVSKSGKPKIVQWEIRPAQRGTNYEPQPSLMVEGKRYIIRPKWGIDPATVSNSYPKIKRLFYWLLTKTFENGDFARLRKCPECEKFFTAKRLGQKYCNLKCTTAADKKDASDRMKRHRKEIEEDIKAKGLPKLSRLASLIRKNSEQPIYKLMDQIPELKKVRKHLGELWEKFEPVMEQIIDGGKEASIWPRLPPRMKKALAEAPL